MSKTGKIVSLEKNSVTLSPITDAKFVQYENDELTVSIKNKLTNIFSEQPCVNVKEGLDALTKLVKEEKVIEVEFSGISTITQHNDQNTYYRYQHGDKVYQNENYYCWGASGVVGVASIYTKSETPRVGDMVYVESPYEGEEGDMITYDNSVASYNVEYSASKTYSELSSAINDGKYVVGLYNGGVFNDNFINNNTIYVIGTDIQTPSVFGFGIDSNNNVNKITKIIVEPNNYYTKTQIDNKLNDYSTDQEVDTKLGNYYTKNQTDNGFDKKTLLVNIDYDTQTTDKTRQEVMDALDSDIISHTEYSPVIYREDGSTYYTISDTLNNHILLSRFDISHGSVVFTNLKHRGVNGITRTTEEISLGCDITGILDNAVTVDGIDYCNPDDVEAILTEYDEYNQSKKPKFYISQLNTVGKKKYIEINCVEIRSRSLSPSPSGSLMEFSWEEPNTLHVLTIYLDETIDSGEYSGYYKMVHDQVNVKSYVDDQLTGINGEMSDISEELTLKADKSELVSTYDISWLFSPIESVEGNKYCEDEDFQELITTYNGAVNDGKPTIIYAKAQSRQGKYVNIVSLNKEPYGGNGEYRLKLQWVCFENGNACVKNASIDSSGNSGITTVDDVVHTNIHEIIFDTFDEDTIKEQYAVHYEQIKYDTINTLWYFKKKEDSVTDPSVDIYNDLVLRHYINNQEIKLFRMSSQQKYIYTLVGAVNDGPSGMYELTFYCPMVWDDGSGQYKQEYVIVTKNVVYVNSEPESSITITVQQL